MKEILTEDLLAELLLSRDPQEFIEKYDITSHSLSEYLQALLEEKGLRRIDVIRSADLNETFGYQIFMGQRKPYAQQDPSDRLCHGLYAEGNESSAPDRGGERALLQGSPRCHHRILR